MFLTLFVSKKAIRHFVLNGCEKNLHSLFCHMAEVGFVSLKVIDSCATSALFHLVILVVYQMSLLFLFFQKSENFHVVMQMSYFLNFSGQLAN